MHRVKTLLLTLLILLVGASGWMVFQSRHPTLADGIRNGEVSGEESDALNSAISAIGITPDQLLWVILEDADDKCWNIHWGPLDRLLRTQKRFSHDSEVRCVGVYSDKVVGLSLPGIQSENVLDVSGLRHLRTLRLNSADIAGVRGLETPNGLKHVYLPDNGLTDLDFLRGCQDLLTLDVRENNLSDIPIDWFPTIEQIVAPFNEITDANEFRGHQNLTSINLHDNHLTSLHGIAEMPVLRELHLGENAITGLDGLNDLPALQRLYVSSSSLQRLQENDLSDFAALQLVDLSFTDLEHIPPGFVSIESESYEHAITPIDSQSFVVNVSYTPLAEQLMELNVERHHGSLRGTVTELPRGSGRTQNSRRTSRSQRGFSTMVSEEGRMDWMTGAQSITYNIDRGIIVEVHGSVEQGRLRIYLKDLSGPGYVYADATPGHPLQLTGRLISGSRYNMYFLYAEAVDGRVEGIKWSVEG